MLKVEDSAPNNFERLVRAFDETTGLDATIAIHSTKLGPALGGCRYMPYPNLGQAHHDVMRLAEGMSYKNAIAGLPHGGGKAVIMANTEKGKTEDMWKSFAEFVNTLDGQYITAGDIGTSPDDINSIARYTDHVGHAIGGDSGPWTALGVFAAMKAAIEWNYGIYRNHFQGKVFGIQGYGKVGKVLAGMLSREGLTGDGGYVVITDTDRDAIGDDPLEYCKPEDIYGREDMDIFSPNAIGGVINKNTIKEFSTDMTIICGGANNQLTSSSIGDTLHQEGILYVPDYIANAGGVLSIAANQEWELENLSEDIYHRCLKIFELSETNNVATNRVADILAQELLYEKKVF